MGKILSGVISGRRASEDEELIYEGQDGPRHMGVIRVRVIDAGRPPVSTPIGTIESRLVGPNELLGWNTRGRLQSHDSGIY